MGNKVIAAIDIGLDGGIAFKETTYKMPIVKIEIKPAQVVFARDEKGNKVLIKSGPNKGQFKTKIKSPAKYSLRLDIAEIFSLLLSADIVVIESQGTSFGNSARSTRTTAFNAGQIHACAELAGCEIITVAPNKWKADLKLPKDKLPTVELAEKLSPNLHFRSPKGKLYDGLADARCILHWYLSKEELQKG